MAQARDWYDLPLNVPQAIEAVAFVIDGLDGCRVHAQDPQRGTLTARLRRTGYWAYGQVIEATAKEIQPGRTRVTFQVTTKTLFGGKNRLMIDYSGKTNDVLRWLIDRLNREVAWRVASEPSDNPSENR